MTTNPPPAPPPPPPPAPRLVANCALCGSELSEPETRCTVCGLHPGLGPAARNPFDRRAYFVFGGVFAAAYALALVIVATRG